MKKTAIILLVLALFSCEEKKPEFILSEPTGNLILLKNYPKDNFLIKNLFKDFLLKNYLKYDQNITHFSLYKYTANTKYFIKNRDDPGGFSSEELSNYPEDELATFIISKCVIDTTKKVGELFFYGLKGSEDGMRETDTLIYKCN